MVPQEDREKVPWHPRNTGRRKIGKISLVLIPLVILAILPPIVLTVLSPTAFQMVDIQRFRAPFLVIRYSLRDVQV